MLKGWALHTIGLSVRLKDANISEHDQGKQTKGAVVKVKKKTNLEQECTVPHWTNKHG